MKKNNFYLTLVLGFVIIMISSCYPSKKVTAEEKKIIEEKQRNLVPLTQEHLADLSAIQKSGLLNNVQIYVDSFSFGRDMPDLLEVNTKTGAITKKTNMKDIFVAKQETKGLVKKVDLQRNEILTYFKNPTNMEIREILFKDSGNGFILYSPQQGDTIVSSGIVFPISSGKNSAKIYLDLNQVEGKNIEKILIGEKIVPK